MERKDYSHTNTLNHFPYATHMLTLQAYGNLQQKMKSHIAHGIDMITSRLSEFGSNSRQESG